MRIEPENSSKSQLEADETFQDLINHKPSQEDTYHIKYPNPENELSVYVFLRRMFFNVKKIWHFLEDILGV